MVFKSICSLLSLLSTFFTGDFLPIFNKNKNIFLKDAFENSDLGNSLVVQWLILCPLIAEGRGSIPVQGTKIPQDARHGQKTKKIVTLLFCSVFVLFCFCSVFLLAFFIRCFRVHISNEIES